MWRIRGFTLIVGIAILVGVAAGAAAARPASPQITVNEIVVAGLTRPVQVTHAGDGSGRLFVVEQPGRIRVVVNGSLLATPFLDLSSLVVYGGEQGLLGLAFHPRYALNGYFYVNYTRAGDGDTVIARYKVSSGDANQADPTSAQILMIIDQPYANHNGGQLLFGRDGYLYIGMGDGGSGGDPLNHAQTVETLLGAMLRIDVNSGTPYGIPPDNPFVGKAGRDEIWAIGLRNPWRFSFDRQTGDLYIGDVGQNLWEEVSFQAWGTPGGVNFGWRCKEGSYPYLYTAACAALSLTDPIAEYSHSEGRSVTGGFVYRGQDFPALQGLYFFADFVDGKIWSLARLGPSTWSAPSLMLQTGFNISAFGEGEDGELYVVDWSGGTVRRLADVNGPIPDLSASRKTVFPQAADPGDTVTYTLSLVNTGGAVGAAASLTDTLPAGLSYVWGSLSATAGVVDATGAPMLLWRGSLGAGSRITITYRAEVNGSVMGSRVNHATLSAPGLATLDLATSIFVPRSSIRSTHADFVLPGTQPQELATGIAPSIDCDTCHSAPIYDRWRGSPMSQAGRDPLLWAALSVANAMAPKAGEYCLRCHTPSGWLAGRSQSAAGAARSGHELADGIACATCHRMVDPLPAPTDQTAGLDTAIRSALTVPIPPDYIGSSTYIVDPSDNRRGPFAFATPLPYHTAYRTAFLGQTSNAVTRSRMCATCHNVDNPLLSWDAVRGEYWPNSMDAPAPAYNPGLLFPIERTYDEWLNSTFAKGGVYAPQFAGGKADGIVEACQDCHLQRQKGSAADAAFNPIYRDCAASGCLPEHLMVGGNTWLPLLLKDTRWRFNAAGESEYLNTALIGAQSMLARAATMTVTLLPGQTNATAIVRVTNRSGHKLPTGYPEGRQMWLHVQAYDADGALVYESGTYDWSAGTLLDDPALKVYEVNQGLTPAWATEAGVPAGASFHFVLNNTTVKDNRIPPQGYTQAAYDQPGLRPVGATYLDGQHWDDTAYVLPATATRVSARLYYQTASRAYLDFLRSNGGVDGETLGALWDSSKSPPVLMAAAWTGGHRIYLPVLYRAYP